MFFEHASLSRMTTQIELTNEEISKLLQEYISNMGDDCEMTIPLRSDGQEYNIKDLAGDQQEALAEVLQAIQQYCNREKINEQNILRMTVCGVAGSGKSTWINTLVSTIRKMFPQDNTI